MLGRINFKEIDRASLIVVLGLSIYHVVQRLALGEILGLDDNAMQIAVRAQCDPTSWFASQFTPIYSCMYVLLRHVFETPFVYLLVTIGLKFLTFLGLYQVYVLLANRYDSRLNSRLLAATCLMFLIVGGAARLQINGDLILKSGIYTGMWAQCVLIYALYSYFLKKYLLSGFLIGVAVFLHPANTIHIFLVLFGALFLVELGRNLPKAALNFGFLPVVSLIGQYFAAYGVPTRGSRSTSNPENRESSIGNSVEHSLSEWYQYVLSQDPDDMSLVWNLLSAEGLFYIGFCIFALVIAFKYIAPTSLRSYLVRPEISIPVVWFFYIGICILIELTMWPEFLLKPLVVIQPRRAFYLPVVLLSFFVVVYLATFFLSKRRLSIKETSRMAIFLISIAAFLILTATDSNLGVIPILIIIGVLLVATISKYWLSISSEGSIRAVLHETLTGTSFWTIALIGFLLLRSSTFLNPVFVKNLDNTFLSLGPASYVDYLILQGEASDRDEETQAFLGLVQWVSENVDRETPLVTAGFHEWQVMQLETLTDRSVQSMNVYRYRGLMHFDKSRFDELIVYHEQLLGIKFTEMSRTDGTIIDGLQQIVEGFTVQDICGLRTPEGKPFEYFLTTYNISFEIPVVFKDDAYGIYDLRTWRNGRGDCEAGQVISANEV